MVKQHKRGQERRNKGTERKNKHKPNNKVVDPSPNIPIITFNKNTVKKLAKGHINRMHLKRKNMIQFYAVYQNLFQL